MTRIADITVTGGIDTHKDFHVAAALDQRVDPNASDDEAQRHKGQDPGAESNQGDHRHSSGRTS
jgi:hypothetical protein